MNSSFAILTKRNIKLFFKDKGMFFTSLITPMILLVLYATFLGNVYKDSFNTSLPSDFNIDEAIITGTVAGELISSLLAVSCVTVAFCSNLLMVNDKVNKVILDFKITPVKKSTLALSYFIATLLTTLIISYSALSVCLIYVAFKEWYMSFGDILLIMLDCFLLTAFGTAISSVINVFIKTNGQASAVGTIVSAGYGFLCGAYMPISTFSSGLRNTLMFLPGTYGTSLIRNHCLNGVFKEMSEVGFPDEVVENIKSSIDCNLFFFDNKVSISTMYIVLISSIIVLIGIYVLINILKKKGKSDR